MGILWDEGDLIETLDESNIQLNQKISIWNHCFILRTYICIKFIEAEWRNYASVN